MRQLALATFAFFAVMFTASATFAQNVARCINRPMVAASSSLLSRDLSHEMKTQAKDPTVMATRVVREPTLRVRREVSGQSRPLIVCIDPNQVGCQVERGDAPHSSGSFHLMWDAARIADGFSGFPPPPMVVTCNGGVYVGGPRDGVSRGLLRPPSA